MDILGKGLIQKGKLSLLIGQGGIGKSRLSIWLAVCQILRREFCGLSTSGPPLRWLFIGPENSCRRWHDDFMRLHDSLTPAEWALLQDHIRCVAQVEPEDSDVELDKCRQRLAATVKDWRPGVVVIDPWNQFVPGNENDAQDCRNGLNILSSETRRHAPESALLVVVHSRVGKDQIVKALDKFESVGFVKGSKALSSICRGALNLVPGSADDGNSLLLACGKNNDGPWFEPRGILFDPTTGAYNVDVDFDLDAWKSEVTGGESKPNAKPQNVLDAYESGLHRTSEIIRWLSEKFGTSERTAQRIIDRAIEAGLVARESKGVLKRGPGAPSPIPDDI